MLYFLAATPAEDAANLVSQAENVFGLVASLVIMMVGFYLVLKVVRGIDTGYGHDPDDFELFERTWDGSEEQYDNWYSDYLSNNDLTDDDWEEGFAERSEAREDAWRNMDDDELQQMWDDSEWDEDDD